MVAVDELKARLAAQGVEADEAEVLEAALAEEQRALAARTLAVLERAAEQQAGDREFRAKSVAALERLSVRPAEVTVRAADITVPLDEPVAKLCKAVSDILLEARGQQPQVYQGDNLFQPLFQPQLTVDTAPLALALEPLRKSLAALEAARPTVVNEVKAQTIHTRAPDVTVPPPDLEPLVKALGDLPAADLVKALVGIAAGQAETKKQLKELAKQLEELAEAVAALRIKRVKQTVLRDASGELAGSESVYEYTK